VKTALVLLFVAGSASAQGLFFEQLPATQPLGGRSGAVTIERRNGNTPVTTGNVQVTISADSPVAQVSSTPEPWGLWGPTLQLPIGPGQSRTAPFYVRDGRVGTTRWTASASGFVSADGGNVVRTDSITCDVETGTVLDTDSPAGCFNTRYAPYPASFVGASMQSAHRGSFGVLLSDMEMGVGDAADMALYADGAPIFGDVFARSWVRVRSSNSMGTIILVQLTNADATSPSIIDVRLTTASGRLSVGGFAADANYLLTEGDGGLWVGDWHLLELQARGVGTSDAGRRLWLDGQLLVDDRGVDFSGGRLSVARLAIGEPYAQDRAWQGLIDFDDIRSAAIPLATSLRLVPTSGTVGDCVPIGVELVSSQTGGPVAATQGFTVALDAGSLVFSDSTCTFQDSFVPFSVGQSRATFSVIPASTTDVIQASALDFLGTIASYSFTPLPDAGVPDAGVPDAGVLDAGVVDAGVPDAGVADAGADDAGLVDAGAVDAGPDDGGAADAGPTEPVQLGVGCACSSSGHDVAWLVVMGLWRLRKRTRAQLT
jgi:hypothetical protein